MALETIVSGIGMGESVRWHAGELYFADWRSGEVRSGDRVVATADSFPVSFDWIGDTLLVVSGSSMTLLRDGDLWFDLAETVDAPWNEIVVHGADIYLNTIGAAYGAPSAGTGAIAVITGNEVRIVADGLDFPNGMAIIGDTLIVAESHAGRLTAFDIDREGALTHRRVWAAVVNSAPDGICADGDTIWYADVPNAECVAVREGGEIVRRVATGDGAFSCVVVPSDGVDTLYAVTAEWPTAIQDPASRTGKLVALSL
jgi:sugar lactone lactonase YvrE